MHPGEQWVKDSVGQFLQALTLVRIQKRKKFVCQTQRRVVSRYSCQNVLLSQWLFCFNQAVLFNANLSTVILTDVGVSQEYKVKIENVSEARKELEHHIRNLPDLSKLPDPDAGLAPLPSAGDLFSL